MLDLRISSFQNANIFNIFITEAIALNAILFADISRGTLYWFSKSLDTMRS